MTSTGRRLLDLALEHANVAEGIACAGTSLESRTITIGGKAFLFVGPQTARLKLSRLQPEARAMAARYPGSVRQGANGWTTIDLVNSAKIPASVLRRWVKESYTLFEPGSTKRPGSRA